MECAAELAGMAKRVEELQVWQRSGELAHAVFAATESSEFLDHPRLAQQLNDSAGSILANIAEGFGQASDRAFARFVAIARGSCNEVRSHLTIPVIRRCIPASLAAPMQQEADEISRMLTGFERYLLRSDRKQRY